MQTDPESLIGSTLQDRYRIQAFVAEGAMGAVYRGERLGLERSVAIKFLGSSFSANSDAMQRFEREAKVMSQLDHPNCVSVIDFGVTPSPFIIMEFVTGDTLRETMDEGPVPVERALYLTRGILAGLAHAHEKNIVHRDIKPANVMITRAAGTEGLVRILDFGLAKLRNGAASSDLSSASIVVGTPNYMSPEQAQGSDVDSRTDIYATGVLLFELLTGKKPYTSEVALHILLQHREDPIPKLAEMAPERTFPPGLQTVIDKAMAKSPDHRFATAIEFGAALNALQAGDTAALERLAPLIATKKSKDTITGGEPTALARPAQSAPSAESAESAQDAQDAQGPSALPLEMPRPRRKALVIAAPLLVIAVGTVLAYSSISSSPNAPAQQVASGPAPLAALTMGAAENTDKQSDAARPHQPATPVPLGDEDEDGGSEEVAASETDDDDEKLSPEELAADTPNVDPPADDDADDVPDIEVRNIADAMRLSRQGKRKEAISGLRRLIRKQPKNARLSLALGNLYFEQMWWSSGLEQYQQAIRKDGKNRRRPILIKNAIRALGSSKTRRKAQSLLRVHVGKAGVAQLRKAAKRDGSPLVRKRAGLLLRQLTKKPARKKKPKKKRRRPRPSW